MKSISAVKIICWLIGLSIGGVVLLLILGYVYFSVAGSRQVACMNNIRNVALGSMQYNSAKQRLPGWVNVLCPDPSTGVAGRESKPVSWAFELLPYLEKGDLYYLYGPNNTDSGKTSRRCMANGLPQEEIKMLICPADEVGAKTGMSIVANCGLRDRGWDALAIGRPEDTGGVYDGDSREPPANGVFHNNYTRGTVQNGRLVSTVGQTINSLSYIQAGDGLAATLMFSENVDATYWPGGTSPNKLDGTESAVCFCWSGADPRRAATDPANAMKINFQPGQHAGLAPRPSGNHFGGVNAVFCDAHGQMIMPQIDWLVWCSMHSPNHAHVAEPSEGEFDKSSPALEPFRAAAGN